MIITNENSFKQLEYWYTQVINQLTEEDYLLAIVGNKNDLYKNEKVTEEQGKVFAREKNAKFILASAKDNPLSFVNFLEELFKEFIDKNINKFDKQKGSILKKSKNKNNHKCC